VAAVAVPSWVRPLLTGMEITCADCGCLVDRGVVVQACERYPGCCCGELPGVVPGERCHRGNRWAALGLLARARAAALTI
jgi:hypothetical protein